MSWKLNYRFAVMDVSNAGTPVPIILVGYAPPTGATITAGASGAIVATEVITSKSAAISQCNKFCRDFASLGRETAGVVLGMAVGADTTGTASPLPSGAQAEFRFADIGVESRDLRHAIAAANRGATTSGGGATFGTDFGTDLISESYGEEPGG